MWDPIKSATVSHVDLGKGHSIVNIRTLPAPNTTVAMASTEGTLRYVEANICIYRLLVLRRKILAIDNMCLRKYKDWSIESN